MRENHALQKPLVAAAVSTYLDDDESSRSSSRANGNHVKDDFTGSSSGRSSRTSQHQTMEQVGTRLLVGLYMDN